MTAKRHALACAVVVAAAAIATAVLGRYAEPRDALAAALTHFNATELVAVALLLALRLFLVLLAPAWALFVLVLWIGSRRRRARKA